MNRDAQYLFNKTFFLLLIGHGEMTTGTVSLEQPGLKKNGWRVHSDSGIKLLITNLYTPNMRNIQ